MNQDAVKYGALMIWNKDTSASPDEWSEENPALGQCAVTALLLQDLFGGTLERTVVGEVSHYFNSIEGTWVDATASQFSEAEVDTHDAPVEERSREYVVSFAPTRERYRRLLLAANAVIVDRLFDLEEKDD